MSQVHRVIAVMAVSLLVLPGPVTAAITYAAMWLIDAPSEALGALYSLFVTAQVVGGAAAYFWAARRSLRSAADDPEDVLVATQG